jgi:hypothetical protein
VEGLWGIRPDLPNKLIEIAPQLSPDWDNASATTPQVTIEVKGWRQRLQSDGTTSLSVALNKHMPCPGCALRMVLPLRAAKLKDVTLNGQTCTNYTIERGYGQALVVVNAEVPTSSSAAVVATLSYSESHGYVRAIHAHHIAGSEIILDVGAGDTSWSWTIESVDDPQGFLLNHTAVGGLVSAVLAPNRSGFALISVNVRLGTSATARSHSIQSRLFKLNVTDPVADKAHAAKVEVSQAEAAAAEWTQVDLSSQLNGNLSKIFHPDGGYLEPRPKTCSARIGTDGWSAWTFTCESSRTPAAAAAFASALGIRC